MALNVSTPRAMAREQIPQMMQSLLIDRFKLLPTTLTELALPSAKDAVQEQRGLKMVAKTAPWKVLVIDSIERPTPD